MGARDKWGVGEEIGLREYDEEVSGEFGEGKLIGVLKELVGSLGTIGCTEEKESSSKKKMGI